MCAISYFSRTLKDRIKVERTVTRGEARHFFFVSFIYLFFLFIVTNIS